MRKKNLWQKVVMLTMCSMLVFSTSVVHAANAEPSAQEEQAADGEQQIAPTVSCDQTIFNGRDDIVLHFDLGSTKEVTAVDIWTDGHGMSDFGPDFYLQNYTVDYENGTVTIKASDLMSLLNKEYAPQEGTVFGIGLCFDGSVDSVLGGKFEIKAKMDEQQIAPTVSCDQTFFNGRDDIVLHFDLGSANKVTNLTVWEQAYGGEFGSLRDFGSEVPFTVDYATGTVVVDSKALYNGLKRVVHIVDPALNGYKFGLGLMFDKDPKKDILGGILTIDTNFEGQTKPEGNTDNSNKPNDAISQEIVELKKEATQISKNEMQNLVKLNAEKEIVILVPNKNGTGTTTFSFAKGTMQMVDGKDAFDLGVELITDFTEDAYVFRANFNYDGKLPATAQISFQVDKKWIGKTVYYYQILENGKLLYTGQKAVIGDNGVYTVAQDHCSDYVGLTRPPKNSEIKPQNSGSGDNEQIANPAVKPTESKPQAVINNKVNVPKTGDAMSVSMLLACMGTGVGSLGVATATLLRKRKRK